MPSEIEQVARLQSLDIKIAELEREIAELPKHVAAIEKTLDGHIRRLEADKAAVAANQKDRRRLEEDVKVHEQKISKLKDQTLLAKTNEQYRAFQNEIEFAQREIRKCEDSIIDLMAESEPLEAAVKKADVDLRAEKQQVEAEKSKAREKTAITQKQLAEFQAERRDLVANLKPALVTTYERIRKRRAGVAVAEVVQGRCMACQIVFRPQFFQDLRHSDEIMTCESCGRMLHYNPPVSFENDLATQRG